MNKTTRLHPRKKEEDKHKATKQRKSYTFEELDKTVRIRRDTSEKYNGFSI